MGTIGNEKADELAKLGGKADEPETDIPLPQSHLNELIKSYAYNVWENRWQSYPHARMTKQFYPKLKPHQAKHVLKLGRYNTTKFINLITGHNELAYHASLCNNTDYSCCSFCNTSEETFFHLVTECPSLRITREDIFLDQPPDTGFDWKVKQILKFSNLPVIDRLIAWGQDTPYTE